MRRWTARIVLVALVAALFIPTVPVSAAPDAARIPFGLVVVAIIAAIAAGAGLVLGVLWLLIQAGWVKGDR